ncbi:AAA family ATPase [Mycolicibacterium mengxianglii]|uniref:AAA family ATPase n=1 Tax=Mycolicibacterium mengxianglii TaxID=2736649 RepID=UPI0018EEE503|nr:AAA family ATPase [Mycolicibacterium mengxianglii]
MSEINWDGRRLVVTRGSQVKAKRLVWWEMGLILQYAINLLAAREGKGKSTVASSWAARETRNGGTVAWIGTEESREGAIVPRLIAAGADMDKVIFIDVDTDGMTGALVFPLDLRAIEEVIQEHNVTMLFLDPAKAVVPSGFSGNDDIAVRQYLEPIAALADRAKVTVIGLAHFGKRQGADSGQLMLGSVAWSQVARCVLSIAEDEDAGTRVLTNTKANYAGTDRSVEFRIVSTTIDTEDGPAEIGSVEWLGDTTTDARDLLGGNGDDEAQDVQRWLSSFLANGSVRATEVFSAADAAGYSKDQAKRAKKRLHVVAERPNNPGPWFWSLPAAQSTEQGAPPHVLPALPALPVRSEGVEQGAENPREQSAHECSLPQTGTPSPAVMPAKLPSTPPPEPRQHRRTYAGKPATSYPSCIVCSKPVVAGQGDTHLSCSKPQEQAAS